MYKYIKKYLGLAHSFMIQVANGHGKGANPDHRINVQGCISQAENCCIFQDKSLTKKIRTIRRQLMKSQFQTTKQLIDKIQAIFYYSDKIINKTVQQKYIDIVNNIEQSDDISDIEKIIRPNCGCGGKK